MNAPSSNINSDVGLRSLEEANGCIRNITTLSRLPSTWLGAPPRDIAESLLSALDGTIAPQLSYIRIRDEVSDREEELAFVGGKAASPELAAEIGSKISNESSRNSFRLEHPGAGVVRICAFPLGQEPASGLLAAGFAGPDMPTPIQCTVLELGANQVVTAFKNSFLQQQAEAARKEAETLNQVARTLGADLDLQSVVQKATDAATLLTGAQFGAFFYNVKNDKGESYLLYTLSGAPREAFEKFGMPRNTAVFRHTFDGTGVVRSGDIHTHPHFGKNPPHHGMPKGHLPVRSYLAVPVISRTGEVLGGLFFGHPEKNVFSERSERFAVGVAAQAAIALDNASLYGRAQMEIKQRKVAEEALRGSHAELRRHADELTRFNRAAVGRELRMMELKKEINELCARQGQPAKYQMEFEQGGAANHG